MTQPAPRPNRIREERMRSRLTQEEVAKLLDIALSTVNRHENGERGLEPEMIAKYSKLFKIESWQLFLDPVPVGTTV